MATRSSSLVRVAVSHHLLAHHVPSIQIAARRDGLRYRSTPCYATAVVAASTIQHYTAMTPRRRINRWETRSVDVSSRSITRILLRTTSAARHGTSCAHQSPPSTPVTIGPSTSCTTISLRPASNDPLFPATFSHPSVRTPRREINRSVRRTADVSPRSITCVLHLGPYPIVQPRAPDRGLHCVDGKTEAKARVVA